MLSHIRPLQFVGPVPNSMEPPTRGSNAAIHARERNSLFVESLDASTRQTMRVGLLNGLRN